MTRAIARLQRKTFVWLLAATVATVTMVTAIGVHWLGLKRAYVSHCNEHFVQRACDAAAAALMGHAAMQRSVALHSAIVASAAIGLALGVTAIAREFEESTVRLAWTSGISRAQWWWRKSAANVAMLVALAAPLTLAQEFARVASAMPQPGRGSTDWRSEFLQNIPGPAVGGLFALGVAMMIGLLARRSLATLGATSLLLLAGTALNLWATDTGILATTRSGEVRYEQDQRYGGIQVIFPTEGRVLRTDVLEVGQSRVNAAEASLNAERLAACESTLQLRATTSGEDGVSSDFTKTCLDQLKLRQMMTYIEPSSMAAWRLTLAAIALLATSITFAAGRMLVTRISA